MIGQTISHYKILEKLGEGGMGVVYKAEDIKLKRPVALKFLPHHLKVSEVEQARFLQEAQAVAGLNHPNICVIHALEEVQGQHFIVMEYVDGGTLRQKLESGVLKASDAITYAVQIAEALQEAHGKGVVHRDIKADNIMVNLRNQIKVTDFGLAKLKGSLKLTKTSSTVGTLAYMAPEQIQGGEVDNRSDIFSFGVVLFELLTGRLPFRGEHQAAMMYSILNEDPEAIDKYLPEISPELKHIFGRALEKNPEDRYQSIHEMLIDLRRMKKDSSKISRAFFPAKPAHSTPAAAEVPVEAEKRGETSQETVRRPASTSVTINIPRLSNRWIFIPLIALAVGIAGWYAYQILFKEKESNGRILVAVADFVNETQEPQLDGLSGMFITSLEQSRRLAVLTRSRMFDILRKVGKGNVERIDETLGKEICSQANVNALVTATIRKFGKLYTIDLKVLDSQKNEYIFTAKEESEGQESIPSMLDKLSEKTRVGLKEKVAEVRATKQNVADVTTTNLEAYKHYFEGEQLINKLKFRDAAKEFEKAASIDSAFALAYWRLAYALAWDQSPGAEEAIQKAMLFIDKVPEKERYYIRGEDALIHTKVDQALSIYKDLLKLYPNEKEALYQIGDYSFHQTDYPTAIAHLEKVLTMDPTFERAYQHLSWALTFTGEFDRKLEVTKQYVARVPDEESYSLLADSYVHQAKFDSALAVYRRASELFPASTMPVAGIGQTQIFLGNFQAAETEFNKLIRESRPSADQRVGYRNLAWLFIYRGKYREALRLYDKIIEIDLKDGNKSRLASTYAVKAFWLISLTDDKEGARQTFQKALAIQTTGDIFFNIPLFYAYLALGDYEKALSVGKQLVVILPHYEDNVNASVYMAKGEFYAAIQRFLAVPLKVPIQNEILVYKLAQCYVETGQPDKAIEELRRIETSYSNYFRFTGIDFRVLVYPKTLFLLGKVYEAKGGKKLAIEYYEKLLTLWKDADKDLPELVDAKSRLAKLHPVR